MNIYVTKPYLPDKQEFFTRVSKIFERDILTNQGPELKELEHRITNFLNVPHFQYLTNGTVAIQLALKALGINEGEVITTPFSFVATTTSILWERCKPVFVDIEPNNFTIDPEKIEAAITERTKAIMPVHVFGYACNVEAIEKIARKHNLKVIYDAAHAFGSWYKGRSLCSFGDISTVSFHATKVFHTIEGGGCIVKDPEIDSALDLLKRFGYTDDCYVCAGINAKQDEFNAAMGNVIFPHIAEIISKRKEIHDIYEEILHGKVRRPSYQEGLTYNYAYYPVIFKDEAQLQCALNFLRSNGIYARRYFYPSLNTLPYIKEHFECPVSEAICSRVACLPLYPDLKHDDAKEIGETLLQVL